MPTYNPGSELRRISSDIENALGNLVKASSAMLAEPYRRRLDGIIAELRALSIGIQQSAAMNPMIGANTTPANPTPEAGTAPYLPVMNPGAQPAINPAHADALIAQMMGAAPGG